MAVEDDDVGGGGVVELDREGDEDDNSAEAGNPLVVLA